MKRKKLPGWLSGSLVAGSFVLLWLLERRRPLRREVEPKLDRVTRNLATAGLAAVSLQLFERPVIDRLTSLVESRRFGLLKLFRLPQWLEVALALLLLDYTLYIWHVLMHRVPALWRFHLPHHADLDLDVTTALRFHFGELAISTAWRAGQVLLIGVTPFALSVWQTLLLVSVLFHHSNLRLPLEVEEKLRQLFVTPRLHGIHHSMIEDEANSNWSSGLTLWDRLHGTLEVNIPQSQITIGVPAYRDPEDVSLRAILEMPFVEQRPTWLLPGAELESLVNPGKIL